MTASGHKALVVDDSQATAQALAELLRTVQATGRAGSLTLKIKIVPAVRTSGGGTVDKVNITAELSVRV